MQVLFFLSFLLSSPLLRSRRPMFQTPISTGTTPPSRPSVCPSQCPNYTSLFVCFSLQNKLTVSVHPAGSVKRRSLLQPTVALCPAQSWTETPSLGSLPVVGSKTTPREKTNITVQAKPARAYAQTAPDICFSTERKVTTGVPAVTCTRGKISLFKMGESFTLYTSSLLWRLNIIAWGAVSEQTYTYCQFSQGCFCKFFD